MARRVSPNATMPFTTIYRSRGKSRRKTALGACHASVRLKSGLAAGQDIEIDRAFGDDARA